MDNTESSQFKWTNIVKFIPVIYALLILTSFIKLQLYYAFFNVPISEFLELSEILVLFLDDVVYHFLSFLLPFLIAGILRKSNRKFFEEFDKPIKVFSFSIHIIWVLISYLVLLIGSTLIFYYLFDRKLNFSITVSVFILIFNIMIFNSGRYWALIKYGFNENILLLVYLYGFIFMFMLIGTMSEVNEILYNPNKFYAKEVKFKEYKVSSDSSNFAIGKTDNYIFFYNAEKEKSTAYQLRDLVSIELE